MPELARDHDYRACPQLGEQHHEIVALERDAAIGRREARAREVNEDGAPFPPHPRPVVVTEHKHEIVESVGALQALRASPRRQPYKSVIVAVGRIVAPAVLVADRTYRKPRARPGHAVGPVQHLANGKPAERRPAIPFALQGANTGSPERRRSYPMTKRNPCLAAIARRAPHKDRSRSLNPHHRWAFYAPRTFRDRLVQRPCPAYNSGQAETSQGRR